MTNEELRELCEKDIFVDCPKGGKEVFAIRRDGLAALICLRTQVPRLLDDLAAKDKVIEKVVSKLKEWCVCGDEPDDDCSYCELLAILEKARRG